jgi:hypothetical protein
MESGYIPEATIDRIRQWLAEYRAVKEQQESIDADP